MTATAVLLVLVGVFVIFNAGNFVGVIQGNKTIGGTPTPSTPLNAAGTSGPPPTGH